MLDTFYTTVAQASFTLLALWWVLLQIRHDEWISDAPYRRSVYDVSLYFLLPGMMSLASLLAVQETSIWRWSFAVFGIVGAVESVLLIARRGALRAAGPLVRTADVLSVLLYGLAAVVAIWEDLPEELGIGLRPLELEGLFVAALLLLGVTLAAAIFVSTGPHVARPDEPPQPG
jgi:hypothetical protein